MPTNPRTKPRPLWMNTSKKVAATEADQVLVQNRLLNGLDSTTDRDMVEATTGTETTRTVEATGVEEVAAVEVAEVTTGLVVVDALIMDMVVVEVTAVDGEVEGTMIDEIIVVEEEEVIPWGTLIAPAGFWLRGFYQGPKLRPPGRQCDLRIECCQLECQMQSSACD